MSAPTANTDISNDERRKIIQSLIVEWHREQLMGYVRKLESMRLGPEKLVPDQLMESFLRELEPMRLSQQELTPHQPAPVPPPKNKSDPAD